MYNLELKIQNFLTSWIKLFFALIIFSIGSTGYSGEIHCIPAFPEQITRGAKSPFAFCDSEANSYNQVAIRHGSISRAYAVDATDNGIGPNSCTIKSVVDTFFPDKNPPYNGHYELVTSFTIQKLTCYCLHSDCNVRPTLSLLSVSSLDSLPKGIPGKDSSDFVAKITDGTRPKAGVAIQFTVVVTAGSGGHDHHDPSRPHGTLSALQGTSDANGEVKITFTAPQVAGIHTIKATCSTCSNSSVSQEIKVKVPDLVELLPDTQSPPSYVLVGQTGKHASNHWFTVASRRTLFKVTESMFQTGWGSVGVNDGSLIWGGLFDIKGGWKPSHHEHRGGSEVDLSVNNPRAATAEQKKKTYAELCKKENTAFSVQTLWHQDDGYPEHFHMYLGGNGLTPAAAGGPCCARYKTTRAKKDKAGNPVLNTNGQPVQEAVALCQETSPR